MGVIKRQSIKQSIVNYLGVGIAAISTIFVYPQAEETYGLARFLIDTGLLIAPFLMLGFSAVTIRFFPQFRDDEKSHGGFLSFVLSGPVIGTGIFLLILLLFGGQIKHWFDYKGETYQRYLFYVAPIAILTAFFLVLYNYSSNFKRIAFPSVFQNLIKITLPVLILLQLSGYLGLDGIANGIVLNFALALIGISLYIHYLGEWHWRPAYPTLEPDLRRQIRNFAFFSLFTGIGSVLSFRIDSYMVSTMIDYKNNGYYSIAVFIGNAIAIPTTAINQISAPIIADSLEKNDLGKVKHLYKNASLNLLIVGLFLFICIAVSIQDLFSLMPSNSDLASNPVILREGVAIVIIAGLARLVDMGTSVNNPIINYGQYFRFGLYSILLLAVFNIVCNLVFIRQFGIVGAALATLASLILYNGIKLVFIYLKFRMQPFTRHTLILFLIAGAALAAGYFLPVSGKHFWDILLRSVVIAVIYIPLVWFFKLSPEINELVRGVWKGNNWR